MFCVQDVSGAPYGGDNPRALDRMIAALESAARGEPITLEGRAPIELGRAAAFSISPSVVMDNDTSEEATVIEASGRDRPGLLADLARTLSDGGLSIQSAHIDAYGERAVDAFCDPSIHCYLLVRSEERHERHFFVRRAIDVLAEHDYLSWPFASADVRQSL